MNTNKNCNWFGLIARFGMFFFIALTLTPALAAQDDDDDSADQSNLTIESATQAIKAKNYSKAIELLQKSEDANDADVLNLLGYSHRKLQHYDKALQYYQKALQADATHKGANEYLGELYLETDRPADARQQLAILAELCDNCEEYLELKSAIETYQANGQTSNNSTTKSKW